MSCICKKTRKLLLTCTLLLTVRLQVDATLWLVAVSLVLSVTGIRVVSRSIPDEFTTLIVGPLRRRRDSSCSSAEGRSDEVEVLAGTLWSVDSRRDRYRRCVLMVGGVVVALTSSSTKHSVVVNLHFTASLNRLRNGPNLSPVGLKYYT